MMEAYSVIAKFYDSANTDFDYSKYFEFIKHYFSGKVVELACGSGAFTDYLVKVCDSVIAVDNCSEMLDKAVQNNFKNRKYIQFVKDDILAFVPPFKANNVIAVCDGFNYLTDCDLQKAFDKISGYMKSGGYFIFDISSSYKLKNVIGNNIFYEDRDDLTYLWTNKLNKNFVQMDITVFEKIGDLYKREDESHIQYIHDRQFVEDCLKNAGFSVQTFDGEKFDSLKDESLRLLFICKKL